MLNILLYLKKKLQRSWMMLITCLLASGMLYAQSTVTLTGEGTFTTGTWTIPDGEGTIEQLPVAGDNVVLANGAVLMVADDFSIGTLALSGGTEATTVDIVDGVTLTTSGNVTLGTPTADNTNTTLNVGNGHLVCGEISTSNSDNDTRVSSVQIENGTVYSSRVGMGTNRNRNKVIITGSGVLDITYNSNSQILGGGSIHAGSGGTVVLNSDFDRTLDATAAYTFHNLTVNCPLNLWYQSGSAQYTITVTGELKLNNVLTLNDHTLRLQPTASITTDAIGGFDSNNMINTNMTGSVLIIGASASILDDLKRLYPLGSGGVYAPIDLTGATITGGSYVPQVHLRTFNGKNILNTETNALGRTWIMHRATPWDAPTVNISGAVFGYETSEVTGNESNYKLAYISASDPTVWNEIAGTPDPAAHTFTATGEITVSQQSPIHQYSIAESFAVPVWGENDVYTIATGNWNADNKWSSGATPNSATTNVYILHTTAMNVSGAEVGNLQVSGATATINTNMNFTVNGETTLASGRFNIGNPGSGQGVVFKDKVTVNPGFNFNSSVGAADRLVFEGGIENHGVFNGGFMTFKTNNQTITGSQFVSGTTLTVSDINLTVEGSLRASAKLTGTGTLINKGYVNYQANAIANIDITNLDCYTYPNTFEYGGGDHQSIRSGIYHKLILRNIGGNNDRQRTLTGNITVLENLELKTYGNRAVRLITVNSAGAISVNVSGDLIIDEKSFIRPDYTGSWNHVFTVGGTIVNNGTMTLEYNSVHIDIISTKQEGVVITGDGNIVGRKFQFNGAGDKTIELAGDIRLINKGTGPVLQTEGTLTFVQGNFYMEGGNAITGTNYNNIGGTGSGSIVFNNLKLGAAGATGANSSAILNTDVTVNGNLEIARNATSSNNAIFLNGNTLVLNGNLVASGSQGTFFAGGAGSNFVVNGTGDLSSPISFLSTAELRELDNLTIKRSGIVSLGDGSAAITVNTLTMTQGSLTTNDKLSYTETTGKLVYNGSAAQTVSGEWSDNFSPDNVVIKNPVGLSGEVTTYSGNLSLDGGALKLASGKTLQLDKSPIVSNDGIIELADGTTELKIKASANNLTFPVGTTTGYSPVIAVIETLDDAYIGVKVDGTAGTGNEDGLKRVWEVNGTTPDPSFTFQYAETDLSETEDENTLYTGYYTGSDWKRLASQKADDAANTLTSGTDYGYGKYTGMYDNRAKITVPTVIGAIFSKDAGIYEVKVGENFSFTIDIESGYGAPELIVKANEVTLTPSELGVYMIEGLEQEEYVITVAGILKEYYVTIPEVEGLTTAPGNGNHIALHGKDFNFTLSLNTGYTDSTPVVKINRGGEEDETLIAVGGIYTVAGVTSDVTVSITEVQKNTLIVTLPVVTGTTFNPVTEQNNVSYGDNFSFTFSLNTGYTDSTPVVKIDRDGEEETLTAVEGTYTIVNVTANVTVSVTGVVKNKLQVTIPSVTGAILNQTAGNHEIEYGDSFGFTLTLDPDYDQSEVIVKANGVPVSDDGEGTYTIQNIIEATEITIEGVTKNTFKVTINDVEGVTTSPEGENTIIIGEDFEFTLSLEEGYTQSTPVVTIDRGEGGQVLEEQGGKYTITNVTSNVSVTISGVDKNKYTVTIPAEVEGITIDYDNTEVSHGDSFIFTVSADEGYDISNLSVKVGEETLTGVDGTYTIENITSDLTVIISGVTTGLSGARGLNNIWTLEAKLFVSTTTSGNLYIFDTLGVARYLHFLKEGLTEISLPSGIYIVVKDGVSYKVLVK